MKKAWFPNIIPIVLLLGYALSSSAELLTKHVVIESGPIHGSTRDHMGILSFKGIPFASPPTGELRWASPSPPKSWETSFSATKFSHTCFYAARLIPPPTDESEDCLTINVWTGARYAHERRPVMVWINPGGFQFGSSAEPTYNGALLAQHGVVVVTFNYRLGVLGFLGHPELDSEAQFSGNFGLQDQLAALHWVRKNIASFGGNPDSVTLFGESAGAHSVGLLMTSPLATGLFHKAIMQSGAFWDTTHGSLTTFTEARSRAQEYLGRLQVSTVTEARQLSATVVNNAGLWNVSHDPALTAFSPSIDYHILRDNPGTVFQNGQQLAIPVLAGWNEDEYFAFQAQGFDTDAFQAQATQIFGMNALEGFSLYPADTTSQRIASAHLLTGDLLISEETWVAADLQTHITLPGQVFVYWFTYTSPFSPIAAHTADLAFVFGTLLPNPLLETRRAQLRPRIGSSPMLL